MNTVINGIKWIVFFIVSAFSTVTLAETLPATSTSKTNGCGSGWNRYVVPDQINSIGCDFKKSCDEHDICYGACSNYDPKNSPPQCEYLRCQPGGDLYQNKECDGIKFRRLGIAANERRADCDAKFMVNIVKNNPGNSRCTLFSAIYPFAVRILGESAFVGLDALPGWTQEQKDAYALAINQMFSMWNDARIKTYSADMQAGKLTVDLNKPIKFDNELGLVNVP